MYKWLYNVLDIAYLSNKIQIGNFTMEMGTKSTFFLF